MVRRVEPPEDIKEALHNERPQWELIEKIGFGTSSTVYKARRTDNIAGDVLAAIKVIEISDRVPLYAHIVRSAAGNIGALKAALDNRCSKLENEIKTMVAIRNVPNTVNILDWGKVECNDRIGWYFFIIMDLMTPLSEYMINNKITEQICIKAGIDLSRALAACHELKIFHRDIKPENIFVSENGDFKLGDFGIARIFESDKNNLSQIGTPNYCAPEIINGTIDPTKFDELIKADIYSLGLVLYQLANDNDLPFVRELKAENLDNLSQPIEFEISAHNKRIGGTMPPAPSGVRDSLGKIIIRAIEAKPSKRYAKADDLRTALEGVGADEDTDHDSASLLKRLLAPQNRPIAILSIAIILLVLHVMSIDRRIPININSEDKPSSTHEAIVNEPTAMPEQIDIDDVNAAVNPTSDPKNGNSAVETQEAIIDGLHEGSYIRLGKTHVGGDEEVELIWKILFTDNGRAYAIAINPVDYKCFSDINADVNWTNSSLRDWLNGDFIAETFDERENGVLVVTRLSSQTVRQDIDLTESVQSYDTVFLPSRKEISASLNILSDMLTGLEMKSVPGIMLRDTYDGLRHGASVCCITGIETDSNDHLRYNFEYTPVDVSMPVYPAIWIDINRYMTLSNK